MILRSEINPPLISDRRRKELQLFERKIGIRFRRTGLLNLAFSHRSYANEFGSSVDDNEKLEFLGDSILGFIISEYLFLSLPGRSEGEMAKIKSFVVSENSLTNIAKSLKVENYILIGKGEEYSGGRNKKAILADCMEAIIGAYYIDSGFKAVRNLVQRLFIPKVEVVLADRHQKDYKTLLQEFVQQEFKTYPQYRIVKRRGPDHDRTFWIEVEVRNISYGPGKGKNKKEAEQEAAGMAYKALTENSG